MGKLKEIRGYGDCDRVKLGLSGISCFFCDCTFSGFIKINRDKRGNKYDGWEWGSEVGVFGGGIVMFKKN